MDGGLSLTMPGLLESPRCGRHHDVKASTSVTYHQRFRVSNVHQFCFNNNKIIKGSLYSVRLPHRVEAQGVLQ